MAAASESSFTPPAGHTASLPTESPADQGTYPRDTSAPLAPAQAGPPGREIARLDGLLAATVLALALLVASFPARNSDLWMHLATGRALLDGQYHFGVDPFASTTTGAYWVNHSWLYDLLSYGLFQTLGGAALVALKALLIALLAALLLRLGQRGQGLWLSAVCTTLAVLAMSSRLLLQPICVSYLFLGLTLWLLEVGSRKQDRGHGLLFSYGPLLVLFVLWVNLDGWFLLGPLTVGLVALGQALQRWSWGAGARCPLSLWLLLPASVAVCLLNPHHVFAFQLPSLLGLSTAAGALRHDPLYQTLVLSPFQLSYLRQAALHPAAWAYYLLVVLSLVSFAVNYRDWSWARALLWLTFLTLSVYQARAIPFFAIVAAPILAQNLQAWALRQRGPARPAAPRGRLATLGVGVVLLIAAWPGWLQPTPPRELRRWSVEPGPSLERAARQVAEWRRQGQLDGQALGLNLAPDVANYFAWACPEEKGFFDSRLSLFAESAADYAELRQALLVEPARREADRAAGAAGSADTSWRAIFRARHLNHVILYDTDHQQLAASLRHLLAQPGEWHLLYLEGRTAIFGWQDPEVQGKGNTFADLRFDINRAAFHPGADRQAPASGAAPPAPERYWWDPRRWWAAYSDTGTPRSVDRDEAALFQIYFDSFRDGTVRQYQRLWDNGQLAALAGSLGPMQATGAGAVVSTTELARRLFWIRAGWPVYQAPHDDGPLAALYLSVRAARRGLHANPGDANAQVVLGDAYLRLATQTRERDWRLRYLPLDQLRKAQASVAFNQALLLKPDLAQAHADLADLYRGMSYLDLALEHSRKHWQLVRQAGRLPGETRAQLDTRLDDLEGAVDRLARFVDEQQAVFEANATNLKVLDRAHLALSKGLAGKALAILLTSDVAAFGARGMQLELNLLLSTGRVKEVRDWMAPEQEAALGVFDYHLLRMQLAAATGAYDQADLELRQLIAAADAYQLGAKPVPIRTAMGLLIGQGYLPAHVPGLARLSWLLPLASGQEQILTQLQDLNRLSLVLRAVPDQSATLEQLLNMGTQIRQQADLTVLRGLLALERGDTGQAQEYFAQALAVWQSDAAVAAGTGIDFSTRVIAMQCRELLAAGAP